MLRTGMPQRRADVWVRKSALENAVYDPQCRTVHLLNETAQAIWELCDGETTPEEMVRAICDVFKLEPEEVVEDVDRILSDFEKADLIAWIA